MVGILIMAAGEYGRVHKIFNTALTFSAVIMVFGTGLCLLMPEHLIGMFTTNTQTIQIGASALRIISVGFAVSSISVTACGALEGLNMGTPSLIISLLRYVILIIPAAFVLCRFLGAAGVWHAFWITEWITAAASWYIYRKPAVGMLSMKNCLGHAAMTNETDSGTGKIYPPGRLSKSFNKTW